MISRTLSSSLSSSSSIVAISIVVLMLGGHQVSGAVTEEQMRESGKLIRDVCLPKFPKISKEMADSISNGNLPNEKDAKCYMNCIMEMMQTVRKGKFLYESSVKQVQLLMPDKYKDEYLAGLEKCKGAGAGIKDKCDVAYALLTCFRAAITHFLFP